MKIIRLNPLFTLNISITTQNNQPIIEVRKRIMDFETIKQVLSSADHQTPIVIQPIFQNRERARASMIQKGIVTYNQKTQEYQYLI